MQEDVLGTRRETLGTSYLQCTHCGRWFPGREVRLIPVEEAMAPEDMPAEQIALCPVCTAELEGSD